MNLTTLDLTAWISIYFGVSLLRASFPAGWSRSDRHAPLWKPAVVGLFLLAAGIAFASMALVHRHWRHSGG